MTYPPSSEQFLNPKTFKCTKCGECCRPVVKVSEEEIQRIEKTGLTREDFLDYDPMQWKNHTKDTLKQKNSVCMFLKRQGDEFICSIYEHRPDTCRRYPFITGKEKLEDCRPANVARLASLVRLVPDQRR